jgi:hypothetical protein
MTWLKNITTQAEMVRYANYSSGYIFMNLFLISLFVIILYQVTRYSKGLAKGILTTSFIMFLLTMMFFSAGLVVVTFPIIMGLLMAVSAIVTYVGR